jgi:hypothetical protein
MTPPFALYCKSFQTDAKRVVRLARSIERFNVEKIPFYVSVPESDQALFKSLLAQTPAILVSDEEIIGANPSLDPKAIHALHGGTAQQIVKSEFWRMGLSDAYLCLDSDSMFVRDFSHKDFLWKDRLCYSVIDEGHELLDLAIAKGKRSVVENFYKEALLFQERFSRPGRSYSFGPNPAIWHRSVWESLDIEYLRPNGWNFFDATMQAPIDLNWYGEALLKFQAIPLMPCQPLFKVYHYAWQFDRDRRAGIGHQELARIYSGVIYQSTWDREMDWPEESGNLSSRLARRMRRYMGRV